MEPVLDILKWSVIVGALALLLTLLKPLLDRRYSAKWRCAAWLAMAGFLLLSPVPWGKLAPDAAVSPPVVLELPKVDVAVSREDGLSFRRPAIEHGAARPPVSAGQKQAELGKTFPLEKALTMLWLAGAAAFLLYHGAGTWFFTRRANRWSRCAGENAAGVYDAAGRDMGLKRLPALRVSSAVDSPMLVGLVRPKLLLPGEAYGKTELTFIFRHELTHFRRHDLWYKLVLMLACGLHWFNPLVYLLRREAERDLELTCDDAVVAGAGAEVRRAYSETLLASVHRQKALSRAVLSTHFYGGKEVMKERFRNILGARGRKWGVLALVAVLLAAAVAACVFGVKSSGDGALSERELAQYQELVSREDMRRYVSTMYSDVSYLPPEGLAGAYDIYLGTATLQDPYDPYTPPAVISGTRTGGTVALELEGAFSSRLASGTLTLVDGQPVSFTTPLYTAVETEAREQMERAAESYIASAKEFDSKDLAFTEKYITSLFCSESLEIDGKTFYIWELQYRMKPNDISNLFLAGGMNEDQGWVAETSSAGAPVLVFSTGQDGTVTHEGTTTDAVVWEKGFTWEEYLYCEIYAGMPLGGVLNGWPEWDGDFLDELRHGREAWALEWQKTVNTYLTQVYATWPDEEPAVLRTFQADEVENGHDEAVLVRAVCRGRAVTLLLAHVVCPVEAWDTTMAFWQVCGEIWEPPFEEADGLEGTLETNGFGEQVMLYESNGTTLAFPVRDQEGNLLAGNYVINPKGDNRSISFEVLFCIYHRQTYEAGFVNAYLGSLFVTIVRHNAVNYQIQLDNGLTEEYTFAKDDEGNYYYLEFPDAENNHTPGAIQEDMNAFLEGPAFGQMLTDFIARNGLTPVGAYGGETPLSHDELVAFTSYFNVRQHNGLLRAVYDGGIHSIIPYLDIILYDMGKPAGSGEELDALFEKYFADGRPDTDCFKLTAEEIRAFLTSNFVLPVQPEEFLDGALEQLKQQLFYLEEYDSYYMVHGDTMQAGYAFEGGTKSADGTSVKLAYTADIWRYDENGGLELLWNQPVTAFLIRSADGWLVLSNTLMA